MLTGEQLWRSVEAYARTVAYHFFWKQEADCNDAMQDFVVLTLEMRGKYPDKPDLDLELMTRRAIWNRALDGARRRKLHTNAMFDPDIRKQEYHEGDERAVDAREIIAKLRGDLSELDQPVFDLRVKGFTAYSEIAERVGRSVPAVHNSIRRIHEAAQRYS